MQISAQSVDELFEKVNKQIDLKADEGLFLHIDKTIYQSGEKLWFAGYLLGTSDTDTTNILHIVLINEMSQSVTASERFLIERGVASGSIYIADSLQTGQYSIVAYTDSFYHNPAKHRFFRQAIEVIGAKPMYRVEIANATAVKDSLAITAKVVKTEGGLPKNAEVEYYLYANTEEVKKDKARTNMYGEYIITIPLVYASRNLEMRGMIKEEKEKILFKIPVLWSSKDYVATINSYDNKLADGELATIFYRITSTTGRGVATYLQLLEDTTAIASVQSDVYGMGNISFVPQAGKKYRVALRDDRSATVYQEFPPVASGISSLSVLPVGKQKPDSAMLMVNTTANKDEIITVHTSADVIGQVALKMKSGKGNLKLPLAEWASGVNTISLYDNNASLQTQTRFLRPPDTSHIITIQADSSSYHKRAKVSVAIRVTDKDGNPLQGVFSFSTAFSKKINESFTDIYRYYFWDRLIADNYSYPALSYLQEQAYPQYFLRQQKNSNTKELYNGYAVPEYEGKLLFKNKKPNKPANMIVIGPRLTTFTTNDEGNFKIPFSAVDMIMGERAFVSVSSSSPDNYSIILDTSEKKLNEIIAKQYFPLPLIMQRDEYSIEQREAIQSSVVKTLQAVVVKSGDNNNRFSVYSGSAGCNDYVCQYGILNCRNHPMAYGRPIEGMRYSDGRGGFVIYHCDENKKENEFIKALKPVYRTDVFSAPDLSVDKSLIAPDLLTRSTLYWNALIFTDEKGEAKISFYTNDIKGRFSCILQGVTNAGVIHGRTEFMVVE